MNKKSNRFSPEMRERAVRMVQEHRGKYPSLWEAIESIAPKVGCVPPTLLEWVKKAEVDSGVRDGVTALVLVRPSLSVTPITAASRTAACGSCFISH